MTLCEELTETFVSIFFTYTYHEYLYSKMNWIDHIKNPSNIYFFL